MRGKGGMIVGDLPPYEAFPIGGTNSVRGYSEGAFAVEQPLNKTVYCSAGAANPACATRRPAR